MELHPIVARLMAARRAAGIPQFADVTPQQARALVTSIREAAPPVQLPTMAATEDFDLAGPHGAIPVRLYTPLDAAPGTIVYFHGGGWVVGDLQSHEAIAAGVAAESRCAVLSVEYRLAPEHAFPAPLDDCYAAVGWAAQNRKGPVAVAGDSAGGNLAAACALRARDDAEGPKIVAQALLYPVTDYDFQRPSYEAHGPKGYGVTAADMEYFWGLYAGERRAHPWAAVLRAPDLSRLPPAYVIAAGHDPLCDEAVAYAERLKAEGTPTILRRYDDMVHGFCALTTTVDVADQALRDLGRWFADRLVEAL